MAGAGYNQRNPAVKRLMREAFELRSPTELYFARPLEDNLFEWHFTVRGPPDTEFSGGLYHGRIILPAEYPMKPPSIVLLTPNGRFELNKKICLSISGYHPESWQPSWSIRTALLALIGFMPTPGIGALGSVEYSVEERKLLAAKSLKWKCSVCNAEMNDILPAFTSASRDLTKEAQELAAQIEIQDTAQKLNSSSQPSAVELTFKNVDGSATDIDGASSSKLRRRFDSLSSDSSTNINPFNKNHSLVSLTVDKLSSSQITDTDGSSQKRLSIDHNFTNYSATETSTSPIHIANSTFHLNSSQTHLATMQAPMATTPSNSIVNRNTIHGSTVVISTPSSINSVSSLPTTIHAHYSSLANTCALWLAALAFVVLLLRRLCMFSNDHDQQHDQGEIM